MIADIILGAFVAGYGLYTVQAAYAGMYERRTARLRETREEFYAAAHTMLRNPAINERNLRYVRLTSEHVAAGDKARLHLRALYLVWKIARKPAVVPENRAKNPPALKADLARLSRASIYAIAERQPLWKPLLLWAHGQVTKAAKSSPERTLSAFEDALDKSMLTTA